MRRRSGVLELAILGLLHESPMHGYELRKRLNALLGSFRAFSYGSLYPCLKDLLSQGWITEDAPTENEPPPLAAKRAKIVYKLTAEGKDHFQKLLSESGPSAWDDENFGVHFAFFARTDAAVRMRILEGRRTRLEERLDRVHATLARTREKLDSYTLELQRHGLESVEREVRWLNELIATERTERRETDEGREPGREPVTGEKRGPGERRETDERRGGEGRRETDEQVGSPVERGERAAGTNTDVGTRPSDTTTT